MGYVMIYKTTSEMLLILGANLKALRLALNISQQTAADRSGISLKAVRNLENGRNASTDSLVSYCRLLRKADWIMTLAPPEIDDALFDRQSKAKQRQRAMPSRKEAGRG